MQKQKGISTLIGIIIIAVVAVVLFGAVFAYQYFVAKSKTPISNVQSNSNTQTTNTETVGWKTYVNSEYGFEITYPVAGDVAERKNKDGSKTIVMNLNPSDSPTQRSIEINVTKTNSDYACIEFMNSLVENVYPDDTVNINGFDFLKTNLNNPNIGSKNNIYPGAYVDDYCMVRGEKVYWIDTFMRIPNNYKYSGNVESDVDINYAISTFKFTK